MMVAADIGEDAAKATFALLDKDKMEKSTEVSIVVLTSTFGLD